MTFSKKAPVIEIQSLVNPGKSCLDPITKIKCIRSGADSSL